MVTQHKKTIVQQLADCIQKSNNFVLVKFQGTKHSTLETLRKELKKNNAQLKVVKNTLFEKVLIRLSSINIHIKELRKQVSLFKENSALIALGEQWIQGLGSFYVFSKSNPTISFKAGILDNQVYNAKQLEYIAQLPGKDVLIGKIISSLRFPIHMFIYATKFQMNKFVSVISQKSKQI